MAAVAPILKFDPDRAALLGEGSRLWHGRLRRSIGIVELSTDCAPLEDSPRLAGLDERTLPLLTALVAQQLVPA